MSQMVPSLQLVPLPILLDAVLPDKRKSQESDAIPDDYRSQTIEPWITAMNRQRNDDGNDDVDSGKYRVDIEFC